MYSYSDNDNNNFWAAAIVSIVFLSVTVAVLVVLNYNGCHARWGRSGYAVEWGPVQGCMVEVEPNVWLPTTNLRDITLPNRKNVVE